MTRRLSLKKAFIVSLCVHCVVAVFFCFTVGASPLCPAQRMFFSGELLGSGIVSEPPKGGGRGVLPVLRLPESAAPALVSGFSPAKPCSGVFLSQKKLPVQVVAAAGSSPVLREPVLFLHPQLPAQLELYFKDRQEVHIELLFSISPSQDKSVIEVKRRISSGNLHADLLSRRYISHYLFIQRGRFAPGQWHPVKVGLSVAPYDTH